MQLTARIDRQAYQERYGEDHYDDFPASFSNYLSHVAVDLGLESGERGRFGFRGVYHFRGVTVDATFGMIRNPTPDCVAYASVRLATCDGEKRMAHVARMLTHQVPELRETEVWGVRPRFE